MVLDGKLRDGRLVIVSVCCHPMMLPHYSDLGWVSLMGFSSVPVLVLEFFCCPNCLYVKAVSLRLTWSQHRRTTLNWLLCP